MTKKTLSLLLCQPFVFTDQPCRPLCPKLRKCGGSGDDWSLGNLPLSCGVSQPGIIDGWKPMSLSGITE